VHDIWAIQTVTASFLSICKTFEEETSMVCVLDKLYAVSDLHMGGPAGTMAFRESDALAWLIEVAIKDQCSNVGLLLNGDIFDFLAEDDAKEFRLDADAVIRRHSSGELKPVFDALQGFVATNNRRLILQIGNHDIELALPDVQRAFIEVLGATSDQQKARILFETSGKGWFGVVGGRLVQAIHGNVCDPWNVVDHDALAKAAAAQGTTTDPIVLPETNAGTMLVVQAMNAIKKVFPFVDLLKPETAPLMAVLDAVDAKTSTTTLLRCLGRLEVQRGTAGELLRNPANRPVEATGLAAEIESFLASAAAPTPQESLLMRAERDLRGGETPRGLAGGDRGHLRMAADWARVKRYEFTSRGTGPFRSGPDYKALRQALRDWLADDDTFDPNFWSAIDRRIAAEAARGVDVLIAGHTHFAREQTQKRMTYLNTGSWMRVLNLQGSSYLESDAQFQPLWNSLNNPDIPGPRKTRKEKLAELDFLNLDIRKRPVAVVDRISASLNSVSGSGRPYQLVPYGATS
jgi:UDP-2,3-diacylglucosamine pyrophosphatase LpxH